MNKYILYLKKMKIMFFIMSKVSGGSDYINHYLI